MDFSLMHAGLAAGAALASVPVILHLFMKQTPKHVIFPALRLIRERQKRSRKKLRIKNWLLLLARMALVALMALALARPSLYSQTNLGDQEVPTALALVFDTSLSMGYKEKDKTRLQEAKERAYEILKKMPDTSQVFVVNSAEPGALQPLSPASAHKRIEVLELRAANRSLNAALGQAYAAVADCDRPRHEIYVLTDLARSSWDPSRPVEGLEKIKKVKSGVNTYILRLNPKDVSDVAVADAVPTPSVATAGVPIDIRTRIVSLGPEKTTTVEFVLDNVPRDKKAIQVPANGEADIRFTTPKLNPSTPLHQGFVRLRGVPDHLEFDDIRFFTFKVEEAAKVLIVTDRSDDAQFIKDALDPDPASLPAGTPRDCEAKEIRTPELADLPREALKDYACIFLNNIQELGESEWSRLNAYVRDGGGLVIGLGNRCRPENYNLPSVVQLLPAKLGKVEPASGETTFKKITDLTHPLFSRYHQQLDAFLSEVPIYHYWSVTASEGARTLMTFADDAPALLERTFKGGKTGRVLLWTTSLARRPNPKLDSAWNEFPLPSNPAFFMLMNSTLPYLAGAASEPLNFEAGQDVTLPIDPTHRFKNYIVHSPDGKTTDRLSPPVTSDSLVIVSPQQMGLWTVTASGENGENATLGFSVNAPIAEMRLAPLEKAELDTLFGKDGYHLATDADSLQREVIGGRVGFEIFPWLMALILILVTLENLLANKFHRESAAKPALGAAT
jgi:hypothetical protein